MKFHPFTLKFIDSQKSENNTFYHTDILNENTKMLLSIPLPKNKIYENFKENSLHNGDIIMYKNKLYMVVVSVSPILYKVDRPVYYKSIGVMQLHLEEIKLLNEKHIKIQPISNSYKKLGSSFLSNNHTNNNNLIKYITNFIVHEENMNEILNKALGFLNFNTDKFYFNYTMKKYGELPSFLISVESENNLEEFLISKKEQVNLYKAEKNKSWNIVLSEHMNIFGSVRYNYATGTYFYLDGIKVSNDYFKRCLTSLNKDDLKVFNMLYELFNNSFLCLDEFGRMSFHSCEEFQPFVYKKIFKRRKFDTFTFLNNSIIKIDKLKIFSSEKNSLVETIYEHNFLKLINTTKYFC